MDKSKYIAGCIISNKTGHIVIFHKGHNMPPLLPANASKMGLGWQFCQPHRHRGHTSLRGVNISCLVHLGSG